MENVQRPKFVKFFSEGKNGDNKEITVEVTVPLDQVVLSRIDDKDYILTVSSVSWAITKKVYDKFIKLADSPKLIK